MQVGSLVEVLGGVPIARVRPVALKLEDYASTSRVEASRDTGNFQARQAGNRGGDTMSKCSGSVAGNWRGNNHGRISYSFSHGFPEHVA